MKRRVYFFCRSAPAYQDDVVVLARGLRELGADVFGSCNYWKNSPATDDWLVRHDPAVSHHDCDVVVVSYGWSRWIDLDFRVYETPLPPDLFAPGRRYRTVYLDLEDGYFSCGFQPEYRGFDAIFRAKYNQRCFHPANHHPWALGLSERMLACTAEVRPWAERDHDLLVNFNASHPYVHPARAMMERRFVPAASRQFTINRERDDLTTPPADPWDRLMWEQTQHRHSRNYYHRLGRAQAVAAFCGELIPAAPFAPPYLVGGGKAHYLRSAFNLLDNFDPRPARLIQWDSWRFWEALAAGCLVFNFDLPYYGIKLPVMPENFTHYIGVRPDNLAETFARLDSEPDLAERIAAQGRAWALEHYSPKALAQRFLATLATS
ncbi:MAG: glycosyltransferase family 1 protein [Verrucomicrobia bacterium]|nr:glycosyltransferase family 1 protein [Verrucomicrobiota bacterium]